MVEKICDKIVRKMKQKMPEIDEQRAEIIGYGLQNLIGEIPKMFLLFAIGFLLGVGKLTIFTFLIILPYRMQAGGFHAKTHIGCIFATNILYVGTALVSKYIVLESTSIKYILIGIAWIFGIMMCKLYAPADTENVPILRKKERKKKKILAYCTLTITLGIAIFVKDSTISNIILFGVIIQTITITRLAYQITNNKYGHEIYEAKPIT